MLDIADTQNRDMPIEQTKTAVTFSDIVTRVNNKQEKDIY